MVKCSIKGCKKRAKFKGKTLCFYHLYNKVHVEADMPFDIVTPKKRVRRKKDEPIEQVAHV